MGSSSDSAYATRIEVQTRVWTVCAAEQEAVKHANWRIHRPVAVVILCYRCEDDQHFGAHAAQRCLEALPLHFKQQNSGQLEDEAISRLSGFA